MKKKTKAKAKIAVGTTVGALLAVAGSALFFTKTKTGKETGKKIKLHAVHLGKEISHKVTKAKKLTKEKYDEIVDEIVDEYAKKKKIASQTTTAVKKELKSHWTQVKKELKK